MSEFERIERLRSELVPAIAPRRTRIPKSRRRFKRLSTWNDAPEFLRDNEFIRSGYRTNYSFLDVLKSLFLLHNETLNVWTHLFGLFVFVGLTIYIAQAPPAPLAHPRESLEKLWDSVQDNIHAFGDHIGDSVHSLQDSFDLQLGSLHASLHDSLNVVQSHLHENLEHARETLYTKMEPLTTNLEKTCGTLFSKLYSFQNGVESVAGTVNTRLITIRGNLEKSYNTVEESFHNLKHALPGDFASACGSIKKSLLALQDNLNRLQHHLIDSTPKPVASNMTEPSSMDQCQTMDSLQPSSVVNGWMSSDEGVVRWPMFLYTTGAMICLFLSSFAHLFGCCSVHMNKYMWKLDYTGISVLIVTSFYPPIYYGFLCQPHWVIFYLISTTMLGLGTILMSLADHLQTAKFRAFRGLMFSALGLFGIVPWIHQLILNADEPVVRTAALYEVAMAVFYLGGAGLFVSRVPERFNPGAFDILLHSHQIFHAFVVIAACIHFQAVKDLMEWRESTNGCPIW